jgi:serine protease Do
MEGEQFPRQTIPMMTQRRLSGLGLMLALTAMAPDGPHDAAVGTSYRVPYRLTQTNHYLVRVRINGKGPFNFLVDTGAPALYIGTEVARKIGLTPSKTDYWTDVDRFDLEGGATLRHVKARVDDPFQLTGMNALGLPGASIDGILGFTILARFRMEFDPTKDRMVWTRLDYEPKEPPVPRRGEDRDLPPELQMMNALGPLAKFAALFVGKQPEDQLHPRGFLGMELEEGHGQVRVSRVLADSPAAKAGVKADDGLVRLKGREPADLKAARDAVAKIRAGDRVKLTVRRGPGTVDLTVTAGEGL